MNAGPAIRDAATSVGRYLRGPEPPVSDGEIEEELAFHIGERSRELQSSGLSEEEADRLARDRFGDPRAVASACRAEADGGVSLLHRVHLLGTTGLVVAVLYLLATPDVPRPAEAIAAQDWSGDVAGFVLGTDGRPVAGADVMVVVKAWPGGSYFQKAYAAHADENGRFRLTGVRPTAGDCEVLVSAAADGHVLTSRYFDSGQRLGDPIALELPTSPGVELRLRRDADNEPLTYAEILPSDRVDASGSEHTVFFDAAEPLRRLTDRGGRVRLPYLRPGDRATLYVRPRGGDWRPVDVIVPPDGAAVASF